MEEMEVEHGVLLNCNDEEENCNKIMWMWRDQHSSCRKDHCEMRIL